MLKYSFSSALPSGVSGSVRLKQSLGSGVLIRIKFRGGSAAGCLYITFRILLLKGMKKRILFFFYCYSIIVLIFPPCPSPTSPTPCSHSQSLLLSVPMSPLYMFLGLPLSIFPPLTSSHWSLPVCSLFPCLWFYFAHLFVLLIRFHLQVRSYGICLIPPVLFHLA